MLTYLFQFCYGIFGKPELAKPYNNSTLRFNVSHSNKVFLCGVTFVRDIGIDVEFVRLISEQDEIVKTFCSTQEQNLFFSLLPNRKLKTFYKAWTCKESLAKATGEGLTRPLNQFELSLNSRESAKLLSVGGNFVKAAKWSLYELKPALGYVAALAVKSQNNNVYCWQWVPT